MAMIQNAPAAKGTKPRAHKKAFHLDMTPMVDLAFLLLTFFMLTTTFNKPTVMEVAMPDPKGEKTPIDDSAALTLLLGKDHQVQYFYGLNPGADASKLHTTTFAADGLRQVLLKFRQNPDGVVLIKPGDEASYQSMVDALDEMNITGQKKYALVDLDEADKRIMQTPRL
ncbi:ExbD/TolR family protein [Hymenobacter persicinus]|uniref:Biopolymer transporter ExbD n=1 Tax=Hymenobacter persicinus TaxID=2025506 RepID=A0A4Q5L6A5_9BACT|nr:biopolymer transporter ExbD [Hymenobacter persicinus]RYU74069.1 biopolymer transporter ExbD [Hymenobacter persicinus]